MKELMIKVIALGWMVMVYVLFLSTFATAYSTPQKAVSVVINDYGEAHVEMVMLLLSTPFVLGGTALFLRDSMKKFERKVRL